MSKQSEAKERQQYTPKLTPGTCSNCAELQCDRVLPVWMLEWNANGARYTVEEHGIDKNLRCGIGGFAVKKMGSCAAHTFAAPKEGGPT